MLQSMNSLLNNKMQRLERYIKPLGPTSRSEWVKVLESELKLSVNSSMFQGFTPSVPPTSISNYHYIFTKYELNEEPRDKNVKGTRAHFGEIVGKWISCKFV